MAGRSLRFPLQTKITNARLTSSLAKALTRAATAMRVNAGELLMRNK
jgi:hypothetical protein